MPATTDSSLPQAIAQRAAAVRQRIAEAADRAGRDADAVTLVAVSKTFPLDVVRAAAAAGLHDLGENRVSEFVEKAEAVPGQADGGDLRWHFIGSLQRNKARDVAAHADLFHGLDSLRLADELQKRAAQAGRVLPVLVQVNISDEDAKHGVPPDKTYALLREVAARENLRAAGLMGMAAIAESEGDLEQVVRPAFRRLRRLFEAAPPGLSVLSMGMSGDFDVAVEEGATHIRVGTAVFGPR